MKFILDKVYTNLDDAIIAFETLRDLGKECRIRWGSYKGETGYGLYIEE